MPGCIGLTAQRDQFALAVAEVEHPDQRRAAGRHLRIGKMPAQRQAAGRTARGCDHTERRSGLLRAQHRSGKLGERSALQALVACIEFAEIFGHRIEPEPMRQPLRRLDPAIGANQQRQGGRFVDHPRQSPGVALDRFGTALPAAGSHDRDRGSKSPRRQQGGNHSESDGFDLHWPRLCERLGPITMRDQALAPFRAFVKAEA